MPGFESKISTLNPNFLTLKISEKSTHGLRDSLPTK
jgi:hypothetical protein